MVFLQFEAEVAIGFSSQINVYENKAFSHVTEMPYMWVLA